MRDFHDDQVYQAFRHDFTANIAAIAHSVADVFDRLHDHLYAAPWSQQTKTIEAPCVRGSTIL